MNKGFNVRRAIPPLFGHFGVPARLHWQGVLAATLVAGACGGLVTFGLFAFVHFYTGGKVPLSDGLWVGWFTAIIFALVAAPMFAISYSLARAVLTRFKANAGLTYIGIGLVVGIYFGRAGTPSFTQSVLGEIGGIAAGLAYWAVANRGAATASHEAQNPSVT